MLPVFRNHNNDFLPAFASALFDEDFPAVFARREARSLTPAVNISEDDQAYRIEMAAPGIAKEDFKIGLEKNELTISCHKEENHEDDNGRSLRREFSFNHFSRSFILPETADADAITASYENGVLNVHIPKTSEKSASKQIAIA